MVENGSPDRQKSIPNRSQETQKEVLERTSDKSKLYFGIQLLKLCKCIKNKWFFIVFCISTLFKMMGNMEWNVIESWLRTDFKPIEIPSEINLKNDASLNAVWHWFLVDFDRSGEEKWDAQGAQEGPNTYCFSSSFVLGCSWGPFGSLGGLVGAKMTFKTSQEAV